VKPDHGPTLGLATAISGSTAILRKRLQGATIDESEKRVLKLLVGEVNSRAAATRTQRQQRYRLMPTASIADAGRTTADVLAIDPDDAESLAEGISLVESRQSEDPILVEALLLQLELQAERLFGNPRESSISGQDAVARSGEKEHISGSVIAAIASTSRPFEDAERLHIRQCTRCAVAYARYLQTREVVPFSQYPLSD
jgi:hypothetical protein